MGGRELQQTELAILLGFGFWMTHGSFVVVSGL